MEIKATLTIEITRSDGSRTLVQEEDVFPVGDNPRFEKRHSRQAVEIVTESALDRIGGID